MRNLFGFVAAAAAFVIALVSAERRLQRCGRDRCLYFFAFAFAFVGVIGSRRRLLLVATGRAACACGSVARSLLGSGLVAVATLIGTVVAPVAAVRTACAAALSAPVVAVAAALLVGFFFLRFFLRFEVDTSQNF